MSSKTLIDGTKYKIICGKTRLNGTTYDIRCGKTQVGGTTYDIPIMPIITVVNNGTTTSTSSSYVRVDGKLLPNGENILPRGTVITCHFNGAPGGIDKVIVNNTTVYSKSSLSNSSYEYVVKTSATINCDRRVSSPTITITEH